MKKPKKQEKKAVLGIIFDKNKRILLTKRNAPGYSSWHHKWQFPGGEIEFGETPKQTLTREVKEETGVNIKILTNRPIVETHTWKTDKRKVYVTLLAYPVLYISGKLQTTDHEIAEIRWFSYQEINFSNCLPKTKELIDKAIRFFSPS